MKKEIRENIQKFRFKAFSKRKKLICGPYSFCHSNNQVNDSGIIISNSNITTAKQLNKKLQHSNGLELITNKEIARFMSIYACLLI